MSRTHRRRRRWLLWLILLLLLGLSAETAVRLQPDLLPRWYRELYPVQGLEFERPGVLAQTPVEGFPVPGPQDSYSGPPPAGLVYPGGMVDPASNPDNVRYPRAVIQVDENGFPNPVVPERTDVLLVGDSFGLCAGVLEPPGLAPQLQAATGLSVYTLAVPGIGPRHERWLLQHYGLPLAPRAVVWFFFSGNDLSDEEKLQAEIDAGARTYAELSRYKPLPTSRIVDLLVRSVERFSAAREAPPLMTRGVRLPHGPDAGVDVWFSTHYLRNLLLDRRSWNQRPGMKLALQTLSAVQHELRLAGIPLLLVYLPTKAEVMLPFVADQAELVFEMASVNLHMESPMSPAQYMEAALQHRGALEQLLAEFAGKRELPFLSATPALTALTAAGRLGYMCADTHWNDVGQAALLPELVERLAQLGVR